MNTKATIGVCTVAFLLCQGFCFASISFDGKCPEDHGSPNAGRSLLQLNPEKVVDPKRVGSLAQWSYSLPKIECEKEVGSRPDGFFFIQAHIDAWAPMSSVSGSAKKCGRLCSDNNVTIMYGIERLDGIGEMLGFLTLLLATGFGNSIGFGGILHHQLKRKNESQDFKAMSTLLGLEYADLFTTSPPKFRTCLHGIDEYRKHMANLSNLRGTLLLDATTPSVKFVSDSMMTPDFLSRLRSQSGIWSVPAIHFKPETKYNVAVHLRRGDISANNSQRYPLGVWQRRWAADSEYLNVVKQVETMLPSADIHFFSVLEQSWTESDFDVFRSKAKHSVHLNNDVVSDWAHMVKADVLIMAPSGFSMIAALYNPKCVVKFKHFGGKLSHWIEHDRGSFSTESILQLQECVANRVL